MTDEKVPLWRFTVLDAENHEIEAGICDTTEELHAKQNEVMKAGEERKMRSKRLR